VAGFGVNVGNSVADVLKFEQWSGQQVDYIGVSTGRASWTDWSGSIGWAINNWDAIDRPLRWSIPLFANQGNLVDAASGAYNNYYVGAAQKLAAAYGNDDKIVVRVGEEFNGSWMPWAAKGHEGDFIQAYRNFVDSFRSVSDKFVFEWNVNVGDLGMNPEDAYPGDAYVDIIGMDFYYDKWLPSDPSQAWNYMVSRKYGLQWLEDFADKHGKPTGYSEWGVQYDNAGAYIEKAAEWFKDHDVVYQMYWDNNSAFAGKLSNDQYPDLAKAFLAAFHESSDVIHSRVSFTLGLDSSDLELIGSASIDGTGNLLDNVIIGNSGHNVLHGLAGNDVLQGGTGKDRIFGDSGNDVLVGGNGNDRLDGGLDNDTLSGAGGNDKILGGNGNDILNGNAGKDTLRAGYGNDTLSGSAGADLLFGGGGADTFVFKLASDSANGAPDRIMDLASNDIIDLSAIDANSQLAGNQAFSLSSALTGLAGQAVLSFDAKSGYTSLVLDCDGDKLADMTILLHGNQMKFDHFIL
jgi:hypothetical protein